MSTPSPSAILRGRTPVLFAAIECVELARLAEADSEQLASLKSLVEHYVQCSPNMRLCFKDRACDRTPDEYPLSCLPGWTLPVIHALRSSGHITERGFYLIP